ncbi:MAG: hypothetical protein R6V46_00830, partial [Desulfatiglandaceae bacterium]
LYLLPWVVLFVLLCRPVLSFQDDREDAEPSLSASLDQDSATVGSVVTLILNYRLPKGGGFYDIPEIGGLENLTQVDREIGLNQIEIKLLVDRLGSWKTGPLSLGYLDKEGKPQTLSTNPVSLTVLSNLGEKPEEAELRPIQGIIPTKAPWLKLLPWVGAGLAFLLGVFSFIWWYRTRRRRGLMAAAPDPPHIRAVKEIEELEGRSLFENGHVKAFYFRFSEILRRYLEAIRGFPAVEFTTEEIAHHINTEPDRSLLLLLRQADLVKFADAVPTPARKAEAVKAALNYIQETSPTDETAGSYPGSREAMP